MIYKTYIVEDEAEMRNALVEKLSSSSFFNVIGSEATLIGAINFFDEELIEIDVLFLDISIQGGTGFELLHNLKDKGVDLPFVIIVTSHHDYDYAITAINEFGAAIVLILNKPFWHNWSIIFPDLLERINKKYINISKTQLKSDDYLIIKSKGITSRIRYSKIICFHSDFTEKSTGRTFMLLDQADTLVCVKSLKSFEEELPPNFLRISKSHIANMDYFFQYDHSNMLVFLYNLKEPIKTGRIYESMINEYLIKLV